MKNRKSLILTFGAMSIALNVVLGTVVSALKIPLLFLDTIGTVLMAVLFGPWWGALVGFLTNVVMVVTTGPTAIFFGIVSVAIALVVGFMARKFDFTKWYIAILTGLLLSVVAPLIGTPISVALFGGLNGSGMDIVVLWLRTSGESVFASTFFSRITGNFVDKIVTALLVMFLVTKLPSLFKYIVGQKNMKRSRKILIVSHCIFNQNVVIEEEARALGAIPSAVDWINEEGLGVVQLPCPEFTFLGLERPSMTYEQYNNEPYREHCRKILRPVIEQILEYVHCGFEITGILGIKSSPSCDHSRGVFMEELRELLLKNNLPVGTQWFLPNVREPVFNSKEHIQKKG